MTTWRPEPVKSKRVFEEILAQLQRALAAGELGQGNRLPAERELAQHFGASRTSVREALRVLETLGVVQTRPGSDHGAVLVTRPARAFRDILQYQVALRHIDMATIVEFRIVIESWAARAAAERSPGEGHETLVGLLDSMAVEQPYELFQEYDAAFHLEIARASGNDLCALTLDGARTTIERAMLEAMAAATETVAWPAVHARLVDEHRTIYEAVASGDGERAAQLMTSHIRNFYDEHLLAAR